VFKRKRAKKIVGDAWNVYTCRYGEGQVGVISFDDEVSREEKHMGFDTCIRVVVYIPPDDRVLDNGLPVREELPNLDRLEDTLVSALEKQRVDCRFVGRMTYGGMREFVFQVEDKQGFRDTVEKMIQDVKDYRIELEESEGWQFFDEKIKPSSVYRQQIADMQVIRQLIKAGSNPQAPHMIEHVICGDPGKLAKLRDELVTSGFKDFGLEGDRLVVGKESTLEINEIFSVTGKMAGYCASIGLEYDGWGTNVVS